MKTFLMGLVLVIAATVSALVVRKNQSVAHVEPASLDVPEQPVSPSTVARVVDDVMPPADPPAPLPVLPETMPPADLPAPPVVLPDRMPPADPPGFP